jgi:hypothetical protein
LGWLKNGSQKALQAELGELPLFRIQNDIVFKGGDGHDSG